VLLSLR